MTSHEMQKRIALSTGRAPTRKALYEDGELLAKIPWLQSLLETFKQAVPRPTTPVYVPLSNIMQRYFSAALALPDSKIDQRAALAARDMNRCWIFCAKLPADEKLAPSRVLFFLPSLLFVCVFTLYPILESFRLSFYRMILTLPWLGQKMVGWENYTDLWTDPVALASTEDHLDLRRRNGPVGVAARPRHGPGDERGVSRPRALARHCADSLGDSHRGLLANVALYFQ